MAKNHMEEKWILTVVLVLTALFPFSGLSQAKIDLVGTWKLISATDTTDRGQVIKNPYGLNPTGFLT